MSLSKFDEYKLFVDDTARFSERRQTVNTTYITVNSILLAAISFLVKDAGLVHSRRALSAIVVLVAGIGICFQWHRMIRKYKTLVSFRMNQLRLIEKSIELEGCHKMYHAEDDLYPRDAQGAPIRGKGLNFSDGEKILPWFFGTLHAVFLVGLLAVQLKLV